MRPSIFLRALSLHFPDRFAPSSVVPWPQESPHDKWLTSQLNPLHRHGEMPDESYASARWLMEAIEVAVATQKFTIESLDNVSIRESDRKTIEDYLEDVIELLDACNGLRERMETIKKYIESLRMVLHCLEGGSDPNPAMLTRASAMLTSCEAMERRCAELEKCSSSLRKMGEKLAQCTIFSSSVAKSGCSEEATTNTQLNEALNGSKAIALFACGVLGIALSFKTKRGLPAINSCGTTSWSSSLNGLHKEVKEEIEQRKKSGNVVLVELSQTVNASKNLRQLVNLRCMEKKATHHEDLRSNIEALSRSCGQLEKWITPLNGRVDELYRNLISIRMVFLGILSKL